MIMDQGASTQELLPVIQADRERAAWFAEWLTTNEIEWKSDRVPFFSAKFSEGVRAGMWDTHDLVQVFARHRIEHTPSDRNAETVPGQIERVMSSKWLDPECGEDGCQSRKWKQLYEQAVQGRRDFRQAYKAAISTTPEPTEPAGVVGLVERFSMQIDAMVLVYSNNHAAGIEAGHKAKEFAAELIAALRTPPLLEVAKEALEEQTDVVDRLCSAIERAEQDIGGESVRTVLALLGPANDRARATLQAIKGAE